MPKFPKSPNVRSYIRYSGAALGLAATLAVAACESSPNKDSAEKPVAPICLNLTPVTADIAHVDNGGESLKQADPNLAKKVAAAYMTLPGVVVLDRDNNPNYVPGSAEWNDAKMFAVESKADLWGPDYAIAIQSDSESGRVSSGSYSDGVYIISTQKDACAGQYPVPITAS